MISLKCQVITIILLVMTSINVCSAIKCTACQDCNNIIPAINSVQENVTCGPASTACLKLTFQRYVIKGCSKLTDCSPDGLVNNQANSWASITSAITLGAAQEILNNNINTDGSMPISCCTMDFCNNGVDYIRTSLVILALASFILYITN